MAAFHATRSAISFAPKWFSEDCPNRRFGAISFVWRKHSPPLTNGCHSLGPAAQYFRHSWKYICNRDGFEDGIWRVWCFVIGRTVYYEPADRTTMDHHTHLSQANGNLPLYFHFSCRNVAIARILVNSLCIWQLMKCETAFCIGLLVGSFRCKIHCKHRNVNETHVECQWALGANGKINMAIATPSFG